MKVTDPDNIRQKELSVSQEIALAALMTGATDAEAGDAAGVTRQTINVWKNHHPGFIAETNRRRHEIWGASREHLRSLVPKALDVLDAALSSGTPNPRLAVKIIEMTGLPNEAISPSGPTSAKEVLDAEVQRRRRAEFDAMISPDGDPVSELERSRVTLEWEESLLQ